MTQPHPRSGTQDAGTHNYKFHPLFDGGGKVFLTLTPGRASDRSNDMLEAWRCDNGSPPSSHFVGTLKGDEFIRKDFNIPFPHLRFPFRTGRGQSAVFY